MAEIVVKLVNGELAGKTAQSIAKEVNAAATALKKAEIGTQAWVDASKRLDAAKQQQADMKKQIEGTVKASDMLKQAWNKLPGASFFNQIGESFGMARQGVGGLISSMGVLKGAIAATGLGALVLIIASLVSWFVKTDEGATKLDGILRAVGNTVDVLLNRLINLKDSLLTLFTDPGKFFRGLIGDIQEGIKLGQELADTFDELDQKRRDMELADSAETVEMEKLLLMSRNVKLSYEDRLKVLDRVDAMEEANAKKKLDYALQYATAVVRETEFMEKQGTITDEQLDKQNEARIKLLEVQRESIVLQEKIENRRSQLLEKREAEEERAAQQRAKIFEQEQKQQQKLNDFEEQRLANDINRANSARDKKAMISANAAAAELAARILHNNMLTEEDRKAYAQREADLQKHLELVKQNEARASQQMLATTVMLGNEVLNYRIQNSQQRLASLREQYGEESNIYKEAARTEGARIKQNERAKVQLNLIGEIAAIWRGAANFGPLAAIVAGLQTGAAVVRAAGALRNINKLTFETGGFIHGPRHSGGGVPIEAEGGEFIFSRKAVSAIGANRLARINNYYTFANGGSVPMPASPYADRAPVSRGSTPAGGGSFGDMDDLKNTFIAYAEAMDKRIDRIQVSNNLQDTDKGLKVLQQLKAEADV